MIHLSKSDGMSIPQIFKTYSMNKIYQINSLKLEYTKFYPVIRSKYLCISSYELTKSLTFTVFNILCTQYSSRLSTNNMMMIMMIMAYAQKNSINIVLCLTYVSLWNMINKNISVRNFGFDIHAILSFLF